MATKPAPASKPRRATQRKPAVTRSTVPTVPSITGPEAPNSPRAGLPILSVGSTDPMVPQICAALDKLGYPTPTSRGENPHAIVGPEELAAARQFRRDNGVADDPDAFGHDEAEQHIGPWTIDAILNAAPA